jgi:LuxR family transcriptional regulator, quorum-sensing system regulator SolR
MKAWQQDQLELLLSTKNPEQLFQRLVALSRQLDFDYCAYGIRMPLPVTSPRIVMYNNYPGDWRRIYLERSYVDVDPTVKHGGRSMFPVVWSDKLFEPAQELWEEARSFGLRHGWARSSFGNNGIAGLMTLSRAAEPLSEIELRDKSMMMDWLTQAAHIAMSKCLVPKLMPELEAKLSKQEIAVLRWTGEGYCSREIADLMNIAERTVNFHANNAMVKLNASNKTAAVMRAAVLGLLY